MPYEYYCKTKPSKPKFQVCPELDTENTAECESGARAAFIISDEALQKLVNKTEGKDYSVKKGTISKVFEEQEQQWRNKELCIDKLHAEKVGIDEKSIEVMEKNWKTSESELDTKNKPLVGLARHLVQGLLRRRESLETQSTQHRLQEQLIDQVPQGQLSGMEVQASYNFLLPSNFKLKLILAGFKGAISLLFMMAILLHNTFLIIGKPMINLNKAAFLMTHFSELQDCTNIRPFTTEL